MTEAQGAPRMRRSPCANGPAYDEFASTSGLGLGRSPTREELRLSAREDRVEALRSSARRWRPSASSTLDGGVSVARAIARRSSCSRSIATAGRPTLRSFQAYRPTRRGGSRPRAVRRARRARAHDRDPDPRLDERPTPRALATSSARSWVRVGSGVSLPSDPARRGPRRCSEGDPPGPRRRPWRSSVASRAKRSWSPDSSIRTSCRSTTSGESRAWRVPRDVRLGRDRRRSPSTARSTMMRCASSIRSASALSVAHHAGVVHLHQARQLAARRRGQRISVRLRGPGSYRRSPADLADVLRSAGSPAYASPEQMTGQAITPASDIYSLGVLDFSAADCTAPLPNSNSDVAHRREARRGRCPSFRRSARIYPRRSTWCCSEPTCPSRTGGTARSPSSWTLCMRRVRTGGRMTTDELAPERPARAAGRGADVTTAAWIVATNPYKGLRSFEEADAADFFGRSGLVDDLVVRMKDARDDSRFLAVVGPSGSGKSCARSCRAAPDLASTGALPGSEPVVRGRRWRPGAGPSTSSHRRCARLSVNPPTSLPEPSPRSGQGNGPRRSRSCRPRHRARARDRPNSLRRCSRRASRTSALDVPRVVVAAATMGGRLRVVATLRADFFDRPLTHRSIGELMAAHNVAITPLSAEELERAVVGPCRTSRSPPGSWPLGGDRR